MNGWKTHRFLALAIFVVATLAPTLGSAQAEAGEGRPAPPSFGESEIRSALERYRREPSVLAVVEAARAARSASPSRVRDAMDRARATGWLPTTRASVRRGQTVDLRGLGGGEVDEITNVSTDDALTFDAALTFRFDRIVFAPEEPGLLRELRAVEAERERVTGLVVHLYFERRRLQLERDLTRVPDASRTLRLLELEALLDAFTDGAFTRMIGGSIP